MSKIGLFFGSTTGKTEAIAEMIQEMLGEDVVTLHNMADVEDVSELDAYENLIVASPTWNIGDLQDDWEALYDDLDNLDFSGKTVAYFGTGDQIGYSENFMDAVGILEEKISEKGGKTIGCWSVEGYDFEESKALKNGKFVGLAIDDDNQSELTEERVSAWVSQIKSEFGV
ncbi:flavodoxin FldA [Oscillatoriales cyanobacterium LEGE 11467]|uniref:Flavodoxin n=1 Tax=Zarconia navalis LEGE 11467 TaxID=1828826 RepID=A0A928Z9M4_9CYAN|nr:flavodoxin FldA [Zarconia navalis]MBE9041859.1 flavodoxin FldA [Zarconia navalis LEGE 11467]